ncbi:MAG TPA: hypothetical protein VHZ25_05145 [Acidobacteriaceae bacterium]|jgi:hypothetical protein|nr:hypothetical protein [Acidobacteriaceae bacterium]
MSSSRKKAIFRKFSRDWVAGYLPASGFVHEGRLEMLDLDGKVISLAAADLKWVCYVRDFNSGELNNPERLVRKTFAGRPRGDGLFVRARLKDGDMVEGLAANDATLVSSEGLFLTPPDLRSNTQRLWIPRGSIEELEVVAVIGAAKRKPVPVEKPAQDPAQEELFSEKS